MTFILVFIFEKIQKPAKTIQGRNWLPNTGWAIINVAECGVPPPSGGAFYSDEILGGAIAPPPLY